MPHPWLHSPIVLSLRIIVNLNYSFEWLREAETKREGKGRIKNKNIKITRKSYRRKRSEAPVLPFRSPDETMAQPGQCSPRKTSSLRYLAGGANRFLAASPTAGGVGGRMAYGGARGGGRLSEAHFVGGRYGAARRHPQRPGRLPQPHIRWCGVRGGDREG